jgi:hypothetical protein
VWDDNPNVSREELIIEHILRICHAIGGLGPMAIRAEGACVDKDQRTMGWRDMA